MEVYYFSTGSPGNRAGVECMVFLGAETWEPGHSLTLIASLVPKIRMRWYWCTWLCISQTHSECHIRSSVGTGRRLCHQLPIGTSAIYLQEEFPAHSL